MKRILFIDDDKEMLQSLERIMSHKSEYTVTYLQESRIGNEIFQQDKFDLVISDLVMKDLSGLDILKSCKEKCPETPVIIISGYGTIEASVEAIKLGAFDFIEKPFTSKKLFETIENAIKANDSLNDKKGSVKDATSFHGIIYKSRKMQEIIEMIQE